MAHKVKNPSRKPTTRRRPAALARVERATVQLPSKGGRGVLVPGGYVLTAAHCIGWSHEDGMGPGDEYRERAWTADGRELLLAVLAVEPVHDIAVLGPPDTQDCPEEADAFDEFTGRTDPVPLFRGDMEPYEVHEKFGRRGHCLSVLVFNRDGEWVKATASVTRLEQPSAFLEPEKPIQSGASGGPIVTPTGELVGIVSYTTEPAAGGEHHYLSGHAPRPLYALPAWVVNGIAADKAGGGPPPDSTAVLDLLDAFRRAKALFAAVALGVFDRLADGPAPLADLARDLHADAGALARLLDACACLGLLARDGDRYANTPTAAAYLCSSSPLRLTGYVRYSDAVLWKLWDHLDDAVREGTPRWRQAFGLEGPIFDHFFRTDEAKREFLLGMHGLGQISSPRVAEAFGLARFRRLVDLGGATGHLAVAACRCWPKLRAVVFDLPAVLPLGRKLVRASGLADRIKFVGGDFFADPLPEADLFALGRILHDWGDDKVRLLLRAVHERLPPGGALLVAEKLLDDDRAGPARAVFQSLNMLVCTEGRERTLGEYEMLLREAGFSRVERRRTDSPLDAILAIKE